MTVERYDELNLRGRQEILTEGWRGKLEENENLDNGRDRMMTFT